MNKAIPTGFITGLGKHSAKSFGTDLGMDKVIKAETGFKFMNFERKVLQQYHPLLVKIWLE